MEHKTLHRGLRICSSRSQVPSDSVVHSMHFAKTQVILSNFIVLLWLCCHAWEIFPILPRWMGSWPAGKIMPYQSLVQKTSPLCRISCAIVVLSRMIWKASILGCLGRSPWLLGPFCLRQPRLCIHRRGYLLHVIMSNLITTGRMVKLAVYFTMLLQRQHLWGDSEGAIGSQSVRTCLSTPSAAIPAGRCYRKDQLKLAFCTARKDGHQ